MVSLASGSILSFIVIIIAIVVIIGNSIYMYSIMQALNRGRVSGLSKTGAIIFFIADIILAILLVGYFFWSIYKTIVSSERREKLSMQVVEGLNKPRGPLVRGKVE